MPEYYIGLMSGTSVDAVDTVLVNLENNHIDLIDSYSHPISKGLEKKIISICNQGKQATLNDCASLDNELGNLFADAAIQLLKQAGLQPQDIRAIASHGQTVFHNPNETPAYTVQLGDANIIAEKTGITTVADFRRRDMAAGGQGAPLVPAFHHKAFYSDDENRAIVNIGGIANITILPANKNQSIRGFDTGPGNTLLDQWAMKNLNQSFDKDAQFASQGKTNQNLLNSLLDNAFFKHAPPKSTGRELFNIEWLLSHKGAANLSPEDIQKTLCELTAHSIHQAIQTYAPDTQRILVCGGGCHNPLLMSLLNDLADPIPVDTTDYLNLSPDWVEATAFAWMAQRTLEKQCSNLPAVTGARSETILGAVYSARPE
ncbi:MAG: anhydro-N-acetylmuramic acid kinase [Gammaproteobacteria bacterium]|nr:anhydro-N-acetylmuramic acid kinase [Gammaproteobacteria bacterium]